MKRSDFGGTGSSYNNRSNDKERGWDRIRKAPKKGSLNKDDDDSEIKGLNSQLGKKREPRTLFKKIVKSATTHFRKEGDKKKARMHLKDTEKRKRTQFGTEEEVLPEETEETKATPTRLASENYTKAYMKKKHELLMAARKKQAASAEAKDPLAEQKANGKRARARWLQDQVFIWKRKLGTGEYEDDVIHGNITIYERELYSIEFQYRP